MLHYETSHMYKIHFDHVILPLPLLIPKSVPTNCLLL